MPQARKNKSQISVASSKEQSSVTSPLYPIDTHSTHRHRSQFIGCFAVREGMTAMNDATFHTAAPTMEYVMRLPEVLKVSGASRPSIYRWMELEKSPFPQQVRLGKSAVGWSSSEVMEWLAERKAARPERQRPQLRAA